jgi:hypothetical protein
MQTLCRRRFLECTSYPAGIMSYRPIYELTWSTFLRSRLSEVVGDVQWLKRKASLILGHSMRDFWRTNWHWERCCYEHLGLPLSVSFHLYVHTLHLPQGCITLAIDNISLSLPFSLDYLAGDRNWFHSIKLAYVNLCFVILQACKCIFIRNISAIMWQQCCLCILRGILFLSWILFTREGVWCNELKVTVIKLRTQ